MRALFDPSVDQIRIPTGDALATDQDSLVSWFSAGFTRDGTSTTVRIEATRMRVLSPDTALVDLTFGLHGAGDRRVSAGHATFMCVKTGQTWKVVAIRFGSSTVP